MSIRTQGVKRGAAAEGGPTGQRDLALVNQLALGEARSLCSSLAMKAGSGQG